MKSYITKSGNKQIISEMTDSHLSNAIRFFKNRLELIKELNVDVSCCPDEIYVVGSFIDTSKLEKLIHSLCREQLKRNKQGLINE